jgi:hypothetical protein
MDEMKNPKQRTLSDAGGKDELARQLAQQRTNYSNILERMKKVSEEAESNEPLLSQKLYDTVREVGQQDTPQNLEQAGEYLKRSFVTQASQYEQKARQNIDTLQKAVDEAANRLLGDDAEALRNAARQLDELTQKLRNEAARAGVGNTNGANGLGFAANGTNGPALPRPFAAFTGTNRLSRGNGGRTNLMAGGDGGTNALSRQLAQRTGRGQRSGERDPNGQQNGSGDQQTEQQNGDAREENGNGERQLAQNSDQQGQRPGERGQRGQLQGQNGERGQQQGNQNGEQGENGQQASNNQQTGEQQGEGGAQGQRNQAGGNRGQRFFDVGGGDNMNWGTGAAMAEGPITGTDFRTWADQLRDVQEMIDEPDLRNNLAQILDRAREMRAQYVRHSQGPQWNLIENSVLNPLVEVRQRVAEELARRDASQVAPLDRDPVPGRYAELVSRYYRSLGEGAPVQKSASTGPNPKGSLE